MQTLRLSCLVVGLVFALVSGCGSSDGGSSGSCQKACDTAATLKCPMDKPATCVSECEQLAATPNCKSQAEALLSCSGSRPASDYECDMDGESGLKEGVCKAETDAFFACALGS